ncbi:MAG: guanylate kinase [Fimbriimonadaceae bacterium]|nr:MAG: guanylate kinase [Fimbriimonadaceae bacterium]
MSKQPGLAMIVSGPSGVGKDTVIDAWKKLDQTVERVIAYTTRAPREGEVDGVDYHFVSREKFQKLADEGYFLEHKEVHGNFYATPLVDLERMVAEGKTAILKIDVQGALSVMELRPDIISVFILPPSWEELERRLTDRGTEDKEKLIKRLRNAQLEIDQAPHYRYQIVNDIVENCVAKLQQIKEELCPTSF